MQRFTAAVHAAAIALAPAAFAAPAAAQALGGTPATVEISIFDSLSRTPLAAATVQLVSMTDRSFVRTGDTDLFGRLTFSAVPAGRYRIGFMHPLLDELGIAAPEQEARIEGGGPHRIALAVPSPARVRAAVCRGAADDSTATLIGTVRDPRDRMPVGAAVVGAEWLEITFSTGGIRHRTAGVAATTGENGWFALCGLPSGTVVLTLRQPRDTSPRFDLELQAGELRRRDFFVGAAGRGQLRGRVATADSARPLAGARVLVAGVQTESDAEGRWSMTNVPLGTQLMEVRAIGYYPERRPVDVFPGGDDVQVSLTTFQAVLDAVRVTAARMSGADLGGFASRQRRSGMGRQYTAEQIARRNVLETSDLLRSLPGFTGDGTLSMRGNFSDGAGNYGVDCTAEVYVDGHLLRGITASELDALVKPEHILGVEVYAPGSPKPPQFDSGMSGCGSLVIWQKPLAERRARE